MRAIELQEIKQELTKRKVYNSPGQLRAYRKLYRKLKKKLTTPPTTTTHQLKLL